MPGVVHIVATGNFAGVERYVCETAGEIAARGWDVTVVGGDDERMPFVLPDSVSWLPGASPLKAFRSLARAGRQSVCHAHLTVAEAVAIAGRSLHHAPVVSTRHIAARRGSTLAGRLLAPAISAAIARQIAVSDFVARTMERPPDNVIRNGVPPSPRLWQPSSRVVLVLQRLEREKDTLTALRAWKTSRLVDDGWSLRVVGDGVERGALEAWVASEGVTGVVFTGWTTDVKSELARAGILLAPAPSDSFGFGVVEAMAAGVPVAACGAGGHLETVGLLPDAPLFPPGDSDAAAEALCSLLPEERRSAAAVAGRGLVESEFSFASHVDRLLVEYEAVAHRPPKASGRPTAGIGRARPSNTPPGGALRELVVCSLEAWDDVWRRNQFFTDILLRRNPELRVLFVEPPTDPLFDLSNGRMPSPPRLRTLSDDRRLYAFRPLKLLPRKAGPISDGILRRQVMAAARLLGFSRPTLWINDVTYAPLIARTRWPTVYDITDDWLLAPFAPRELDRLRLLDQLLLQSADEVVVCSKALAASRGASRSVALIPNGVDVEHFRRPRPRPDDLPQAPAAVYVGSLHDARIDVELVVELAHALPGLTVVLIGPNSLSTSAQNALEQLPNIVLLGSRPYDDVPAYLQHADVMVVPHRVSPFTDSLDPIKVYECLAVETPVVATPVAGFRDHDDRLNVVDRGVFAARVAEVLETSRPVVYSGKPPSWEERVCEFELALGRASRARHHPPNDRQPIVTLSSRKDTPRRTRD